MKPLYSRHLGNRKNCPDYRGVLISGVEDVLWQIIVNHKIPVACVHFGGVSCSSGVGIRGVSVIQGSGLEGCLLFRGWD